jgi:hypothetical protein
MRTANAATKVGSLSRTAARSACRSSESVEMRLELRRVGIGSADDSGPGEACEPYGRRGLRDLSRCQAQQHGWSGHARHPAGRCRRNTLPIAAAAWHVPGGGHAIRRHHRAHYGSAGALRDHCNRDQHGQQSADECPRPKPHSMHIADLERKSKFPAPNFWRSAAVPAHITPG